MQPSLALALLLSSLPSGGAAQDEAFARRVQGEYLAKLVEYPTSPRIGAQVLALGGDEFAIVLIPGWLPGEGGDATRAERGAGSRKGETVVFAGTKGPIRWQDGQLEVRLPGGTSLVRFERVERVSPTMGQEPPKGATVLFDGPERNDFVGRSGKPAGVDEEGFLKMGATSRTLHGDALVHVEFRSPFEPADRGQARGNSGVYLQGRYEVQILDSFGLSGEHNECGGIYSLRRPDVNMCYPPGSWQTYDIEFRAAVLDDEGKVVAPARLTVRHNGVTIHHEVPVGRTTTASPLPQGATDGPLFLQDHGDPVRFRNVWILPR